MSNYWVDDEIDFLELSKIFLEERDDHLNDGLNVETTISAEKGLEMLKNNDFDVVISDYRMPEMDGLKFLKTLRNQGDNIPFILLTGEGDEEIAMKALNIGADRYFRKDGDPKMYFPVLRETLNRVMEYHKLEKRKNYLHSLLTSKLRKRIEKSCVYLEELQNVDLPREGEEILDDAIESVQGELALINEVSVERQKLSSRLSKLKKLIVGSSPS